MYEWNKVVQDMINWIEANIDNNPSLLEMSREIGYSPFYCSSQFHQVTKMTLRNYIAGRRLSCATIELRDTNQRIIDIAMKYGFSSQEAFTRAFVNKYGCTPYQYRRNPRPIILAVKQNVFLSEHYQKTKEGDQDLSNLREANVRFEFIPAHKFIGIWEKKAKSYFEFWEHHNCDEVCGVIDSLSHISHPVVNCHTAGWFYEDGQKGYFYGLGVDSNYNGEIPEGFECRDIPESMYIVFFHPPFDFLSECAEAMTRVEKLAWNFNVKDKNFDYNENELPIYQRHNPEVVGYEVLRPIKKI